MSIVGRLYWYRKRDMLKCYNIYFRNIRMVEVLLIGTLHVKRNYYSKVAAFFLHLSQLQR